MCEEIISENEGLRKISAQKNLRELQNVLSEDDRNRIGNRIGNITKFYTGGNPGECANAYNKDTWTTRLFYSLSTGLEGFSGNPFANLRGRGTASTFIRGKCK